MPDQPDRRARGERRIGERITSVEDRLDAHDRTLQLLAPVGVHLAEINSDTAETRAGIDRIERGIERMQERVDGRFDHLHTRLRRAEYAVVALSVTSIGAIGGRLLPALSTALVDLAGAPWRFLT